MKPPFTLPSLTEILAVPWNGLTHVSTFSGGGGSCLGFRLAGFRTLWANDLDAHARSCYTQNLQAPIDGRDIRTITAADLLERLQLQAGDLDVFEGSPPCTTFSTAGKQEDGWHQTRVHAGHVQQNIEDLFFEWLRLLDGLRPKAFAAENVSGLVTGVSKGYFKQILARMKAIGYRTEARVLDAQWLGVPQARRRLFFLGIREDLERAPQFPVPQPYRYSVREALPWITSARYDTSGQFKPVESFLDRAAPTVTASNGYHLRVTQLVSLGNFERTWRTIDAPSPTICTSTGSQAGSLQFEQQGSPTRRRCLTIPELKRLCAFPDDYVLEGPFAAQWARLGNSVPPLMMKAIAEAVRDGVLLRAPAPGKSKAKRGGPGKVRAASARRSGRTKEAPGPCWDPEPGR